MYIFWSCRDLQEAKKVVALLLEQKLIACASVIPQVISWYRWKGQIKESQEVKVVLKTEPHFFETITECILKEGSYEVPEITQVEVSQVNPAYHEWLHQELQGG